MHRKTAPQDLPAPESIVDVLTMLPFGDVRSEGFARMLVEMLRGTNVLEEQKIPFCMRLNARARHLKKKVGTSSVRGLIRELNEAHGTIREKNVDRPIREVPPLES